MPVRAVKLGSHLVVASIAEQRRFFDEECPIRFRVMRRVATSTPHVVGQMRGTLKVGVLIAIYVACHATFGSLLGSQILEANNLADVPPAVHVRLAGSMAGFATLMFRASFLVHGGRKVSRVLEMFS